MIKILVNLVIFFGMLLVVGLVSPLISLGYAGRGGGSSATLDVFFVRVGLCGEAAIVLFIAFWAVWTVVRPTVTKPKQNP